MATKADEVTRNADGAGEESRDTTASAGDLEVRFAPKGFAGFISVAAGASLVLLALMRFMEGDPTPLKYFLAVIGGLNVVEGLFLLQRYRLSYVRVRDGSVLVRRRLPLMLLFRSDLRFDMADVAKVAAGEGELSMKLAGGEAVRLDRRQVGAQEWKRLRNFFDR